MKFRFVTIIEISVEDLHGAASEIRHEHKVEIPEDGAFNDRPRPPQKKAVVALDAAVLEERSGIELQYGPQIDRKGAVGRTEGKPALPDADFRRLFGFGLGRFLLQFAITFEDPDLLVQLFNLLFQTVDGIGRVIGQQWVRG